MHKEDLLFAQEAAKGLASFAKNSHSLPGIADEDAKSTFIFQLVESVRRIRFVEQLSQRPISESRKDPSSEFFDPIRAAVLNRDSGDIDEAFWLVFLFVHFGKNIRSGYARIADVYGRLGKGKWHWVNVSKDPSAFRHWLNAHQAQLRGAGSNHRGFGNHRKYQSLDAWAANGTGDSIESYVAWVLNSGSHKPLVDQAKAVSNGDPQQAFAELYRSMTEVRSFGRTARFDYLAMVGKLKLAEIRPDSVHFDGATGPVIGARLLFDGKTTSATPRAALEHLSNQLANALGVDKQAIEDSLCNWQKSPSKPKPFRG